MTGIGDLLPRTTARVIDVVRAAGIDVTSWNETKDGRKVENPAANGRFCYNWVFSEGEAKFVFCLWFGGIQDDDAGIYYRGNIRRELQAGLVGGVKNSRAEDFDLKTQLAFYRNAPVRVIICLEKPQSRGAGGSKVGLRELDASTWKVSKYDVDTGEFEFRRLDDQPIDRKKIGGSPPGVAGVGQHRASGHQAYHEVEIANHEAELVADIEAINAQSDLTETVRAQQILARVGQGIFRQKLLARWNGACSVTGCVITEMLRASHCKPWRDCDNAERLDPSNGLLLGANLDALFDRLLITFTDEGRMLISSRIDPEQRRLLSLPASLLSPLTSREMTYMAVHREAFHRQEHQSLS